MSVPYGFKPIREVLLLRSPVLRDDNFKPNPGDSGSNWTKDAGVTATSDGDILSLSGTTSTNGITRSGLSISTTDYPKLVVRAKGSGTLDILVTFSVGTQTLTITLTGNQKASTFTLTAAKTVNSIKLQNQSVAGTNSICLIAECKSDPIALHDEGITNLSVTRATSSGDMFSMSLNNEDGVSFNDLGFPVVSTDRQNVVYIWLGYLEDDTITKTLRRVFGGKLESLVPTLGGADLLTIGGRGWARALLRVNINKQYGTDSANPTLDNLVDIVNDIIDTVNTSGNGYQLSKSYIQTYSPSDPTVVFLQFVNTKAFPALSQVMDLYTANDKDVNFWVDPSENVHRTRLTDWGSDPNNVNYPNTLNVGSEHITNNLGQDAHEETNQIRYLARLWIPGTGDFWTETTTGWTAGASTTISTSSTIKSVGTASVFFFRNAGAGAGDASMSRTISPTLNVSRLGGTLVPPNLIVYLLRHQNLTNVRIRLEKDASNYFQLAIPDADLTAYSGTQIPKRFSITIGPNSTDRWIATGTADWTQINTIRIIVTDATDSSQMFVDGLVFEGQRAFIAKDSTRIAQYDLGEASLTDNMGRSEAELKNLAKAELFRLRNPTFRITITVPGIPDVLPGQKVTVTAPSAGFTSKVLRVIEVRHSFNQSGFTTELDLTDDLTNYQVLEPVKAANMLLEIGISPYRKRQEQGSAFLPYDPSIPFETTDYPS